MGRLLLSGGDGHHRGMFGAVGGDDRVPGLAGGDDGVQLPQDRCGDHGLGLGYVPLRRHILICRWSGLPAQRVARPALALPN